MRRINQIQKTVGMRFEDYAVGSFYDEMFASEHEPHAQARCLLNSIQSLPAGKMLERQRAAERELLQTGITFNVYGEKTGVEKIFPFDTVPRLVGAGEWRWIERGLKQRIRALNLFIDDVYHDQKILKDKVIPLEIIYSAKSYRRQCAGLNPPHGIWCHITGTDLVRDGSGQMYVLEDNLRCPSGVSYVLENRRVMKSLFPKFFSKIPVQPVADYPDHLRNLLEFLAPDTAREPRVVLLTPGRHNSAYFEHSFLARQMGIELVEGRDLVVKKGIVQMRTTDGFARVDVIYRRIDDDFLDPDCFREDSVLGVAGLMAAYKAGKVALANAPGNGIADDKVVYAYVPQMIRYYLGEDPILPNVPTRICAEKGRPPIRP